MTGSNEPRGTRLATVGPLRSTQMARAAAPTGSLRLLPAGEWREGGRACVDLALQQNPPHTPVALAQAGKVSRSNMALPQLLMASVIQRIPIMFITIPVLA